MCNGACLCVMCVNDSDTAKAVMCMLVTNLPQQYFVGNEHDVGGLIHSVLWNKQIVFGRVECLCFIYNEGLLITEGQTFPFGISHFSVQVVSRLPVS